MNSPFTREQQSFARSVEQIARALNAPKEIDWEQRTYDLAKDLFVHFHEYSGKDAIDSAISFIEYYKSCMNK